MAPYYMASLPDRRLTIHGLIVGITDVIANRTTPDETDIRDHLINAAAELILAAALAGAAESAKKDPAWAVGLPAQKEGS